MPIEESYLPQLPKLDWVKTIRDPIWGDIRITRVEKDIIQTEAFNRLRGIKQLSFAYLSFPGAVHSRFEHSLGVMHVADQILNSIKMRDGDFNYMIEQKHRQLVRLAALLHDIGHAPFSHAIENLFAYYPNIWGDVRESLDPKFKEFMRSRNKDYGKPSRHEDFTDYIICTDPEIQGVLKEWVRKIDAQETFIKNVIAKLAIGEDIVEDSVGQSYIHFGKIFKGIMSGDIDADKIDYLARDNYYCGLPYKLDMNTLRNRLVIQNGELALLPDGVKFVNTVILARYLLITEVHHDMWDIFTTAKAVDLLNSLLSKDSNRAESIFKIFTQWEDAELIRYLIDHGDDRSLKTILTTQYPLSEIARLEYLETHPYIREAIQVLSENQNQIPYFQNDLRAALGRDDIFIHILRVKSPGFDMKVQGGNLLRNEILRGISEESIKNLHLVIYGTSSKPLQQDEIEHYVQALPEQSEQIDNYVENIEKDPLKKLLAYLAIRSYRKICRKYAQERKILSADFLFLIIKAIREVQGMTKENHNEQNPTRQTIYEIARLIYQELGKENIRVQEIIKFDQDEITPSFYREVRKYEQLGLMSYSRKIKPLESEDEKGKQTELQIVFRFDRRFNLSQYGIDKLEKMHDLRTVIPEYDEYLQLWDTVHEIVRNRRETIELILAEAQKHM